MNDVNKGGRIESESEIIPKKDMKILSYIFAQQSKGKYVKHKELGSLLGGLKRVSVAKRLRKLKRREVLSIRRISDRDWEYTLLKPVRSKDSHRLLDPAATTKSENRSPSPPQSLPSFPLFNNTPCDPYLCLEGLQLQVVTEEGKGEEEGGKIPYPAEAYEAISYNGMDFSSVDGCVSLCADRSSFGGAVGVSSLTYSLNLGDYSNTKLDLRYLVKYDKKNNKFKLDLFKDLLEKDNKGNYKYGRYNLELRCEKFVDQLVENKETKDQFELDVTHREKPGISTTCAPAKVFVRVGDCLIPETFFDLRYWQEDGIDHMGIKEKAFSDLKRAIQEMEEGETYGAPKATRTNRGGIVPSEDKGKNGWLERHKAKSYGEYNVWDVELYMRQRIKTELFNSRSKNGKRSNWWVKNWTMKEKGQCKRLINEFIENYETEEEAREQVVVFCDYTIDHWEELKEAFGLNSRCPNISILYGYRAGIIDRMRSTKEEIEARDKSIAEWKERKAEKAKKEEEKAKREGEFRVGVDEYGTIDDDPDKMTPEEYDAHWKKIEAQARESKYGGWDVGGEGTETYEENLRKEDEYWEKEASRWKDLKPGEWPKDLNFEDEREN